MITEDNWTNFIKIFFGVEADDEWIHHVAVGWNYNKNEPGCNCSFKWYSGAEECEVYTGVREAKEQYKLAQANNGNIISPTEPTSEIDVVGIGNFLERKSDDFHEDDELFQDVKAAWENSEKGITARPKGESMGADDFLSALQPEAVEDTQTLPAITDTGAHPKLKELVAEYMEAHPKELESGDTQTLKPYTDTDIMATTEYMEAIDTSDKPEHDEDNNK